MRPRRNAGSVVDPLLPSPGMVSRRLVRNDCHVHGPPSGPHPGNISGMTSFWHSLRRHGARSRSEEVRPSSAAADRTIWDDAGNRYLDATAGLWFCNVGHGRAGDRRRRRGARCASSAALLDVRRPDQPSHGRRWPSGSPALAPMPDAKVFLTSGGSDSIDTATKIVRRYWSLVGEPDRTVPIRPRTRVPRDARGRDLALGIPANLEGYGSLLQRRGRGPVGRRRRACGPRSTGSRAGRVAAFFCEPVIGAGGVLPAPGRLPRGGARRLPGDRRAVHRRRGDHRLRAVRRVVRERPVRARSPTSITCAKGITSGYLPLGRGASPRPRSGSRSGVRGAGMFRHGYTVLGARRGRPRRPLANLDIIEREGLLSGRRRWRAS